MKALTYLSGFMIPFLIFYIVGYGLLSKRDIYGDFLKGTEDGLHMVICLCPTLIGLMTAVGVLRASGFLDFCGGILGSFTEKAGMPAEIVPLAVVRLFSSSGATGLLLDIFKEFGTDSLQGVMGGILLSSTESVFYCMSVYFGSVQIEKTRYTLAGALIASFAGIVASVMGGILLSSTESVFYCMSVYFGSVQIEKTRYTLAGALIASFAGIVASVILAYLLI